MKTKILHQYRTEAYRRLRYDGRWSGYWITTIDGVRYRSERVSGFKFVIGDCGKFITNAILDRVRLKKYPEKYKNDMESIKYGGYRYIRDDGSVEQWHW